MRMKILHTADWHLGKRLEQISRLEEQRAVLEEICRIAEREDVDAVLLAGDIFDTFAPPNEAVELFYRTVRRLSGNGQRALVAIAGNHDSPARIEAPVPLARECGIILLGYPHSEVGRFALETGLAITRSAPGFLELQLPRCEEPLRLLVTPYANEERLRTYLGTDNSEQALRDLLQASWAALAERYCDEQGVNIAMAHLMVQKRGEPTPAEPDDEKPILHIGGAQVVYAENFPPGLQYVALGHLHRKQTVAEDPCPMVYSSSPLSYSMAEAEQQKFVVIVEAEAGNAALIRPVALTQGRPLKRGRFSSVDECLQWLEPNRDALVEITLVSDTFITAEDRKRIHQAHAGVVALIPEVNAPDSELTGTRKIDLHKPTDELFKEYFRFQKGQDPNQGIMDVFREMEALEDKP